MSTHVALLSDFTRFGDHLINTHDILKTINTTVLIERLLIQKIKKEKKKKKKKKKGVERREVGRGGGGEEGGKWEK
ncbi:hypothetical protein [Escherichia coli]|uniref:hypothetical protein n=1 Tax=Escherichia coli TaxID=562 RepID=UPI00148578EB|nr:hypothetical protein [Escherichia coli]